MSSDQLKSPVSVTTRAPPGHNTQPWHFTAKDDEIVISPDYSHELPAVDGNRHELFIGLGYAAEDLCLQASVLGYATETLFDGDNIRLHLQASEQTAADPPAAYINQCQANRSMYNGSLIPEGSLQTIPLQPSVDGIKIHLFGRQSETFRLLTEAVIQGDATQMADPAFKTELLSWIRFNKKHVEHSNGGVGHATLGVPNLPCWLSEPIVKLMLNVDTQNKADRKKVVVSSHLALIVGPVDHIAGWVTTGRSLQRFSLRLAQQGIAHAYLNQPCEVSILRQQLQSELFPNGGEQPRLLLRLGYAVPLPFARRGPLHEVIQQP